MRLVCGRQTTANVSVVSVGVKAGGSDRWVVSVVSVGVATASVCSAAGGAELPGRPGDPL